LSALAKVVSLDRCVIAPSILEALRDSSVGSSANLTFEWAPLAFAYGFAANPGGSQLLNRHFMWWSTAVVLGLNSRVLRDQICTISSGRSDSRMITFFEQAIFGL